MSNLLLQFKTQNLEFKTIGAVLLAAIIAGVAPPLISTAVIAGLVVGVLLLRNPVWGAYALVLSVPVQKAVSYDAGPIEITVTQTLFVVVLGIWWAWLSVRSHRRLVLTPVATALFVFYVATFPSLFVTTSLPQSLAELSRWLVTILAHVIMV